MGANSPRRSASRRRAREAPGAWLAVLFVFVIAGSLASWWYRQHADTGLALLLAEAGRPSLSGETAGSPLAEDGGSDLQRWMSTPVAPFTAPQSGCTLEPSEDGAAAAAAAGAQLRVGGAAKCSADCTDRTHLPILMPVDALAPVGTVRLPPDWMQLSPFLFDTASMPKRRAAAAAGCTRCPSGGAFADEGVGAGATASHCCGVCDFEGELCEYLYPGQNRSQTVADYLIAAGHRLRVSAGRRQLAPAGISCTPPHARYPAAAPAALPSCPVH